MLARISPPKQTQPPDEGTDAFVRDLTANLWQELNLGELLDDVRKTNSDHRQQVRCTITIIFSLSFCAKQFINLMFFTAR